jgi:unsaturated rhamnogalacturonyl hydrolase
MGTFQLSLARNSYFSIDVSVYSLFMKLPYIALAVVQLCVGLQAAEPVVAKVIQESDAFSPVQDLASIDKVTRTVADWQIANPYKRPDWDWTEAALWTGLMAHADITGDKKYEDYLKNVSAGIDYKLGRRKGHGDDHCVGQLHLWHYLRDAKPPQLSETYQGLSDYISRPHDEGLLWVNHIHMREWAWCDALYMSPPTLAALYSATGEDRFLDEMDALWWKTTDYLYNKEEHLYFRDSKFFKSKEANGENVYWSRGNGWVIAGICHVLQHMPADYPSRPKYVALFKEMAAKIKSIQLENGSWHASLLDPDSYNAPESSGTAFFAYSFMWGINNGLLSEEEYKPSVLKAWGRLVKNVHADGKLGYVQPIGQNPDKVSFDDTAVYGVGAFLLLGAELRTHLIIKDAELGEITAVNSSKRVRLNAVVSVPWDLITSQLPKVDAQNIGVRDTVLGGFIPTQVVDEDRDGKPDGLIFSSDFTPNEKRKFQLLVFGENKPSYGENQLTARFVPERKDDFAWENDRVAFRVYGPALAAENARGGVDVWTKSVRTPVVNAWYKNDDYHSDNGTGLDGYKVGNTLGCGGLGYLDASGKLFTSPVFESYEVLESGPVRLKFELKYGAVEVGKAKITETRTITMNVGTHAFHVSSSFSVEGDAKGIRPVAGLAVRKSKTKASEFNGLFVGYWDPVMSDGKNGYIGTFILNQEGAPQKYMTNKDHLLKVVSANLNKPVSYHAGAIWSKAESIDEKSFGTALYELSHSVTNPISVK